MFLFLLGGPGRVLILRKGSMQIKEIEVPEYEKVVECEIAPGVISIISVHNTKMGPALGGCRFYNYKNKDDAMTDVLRLSEGMTYKSAMAGIPLGGGKSVIMGHPETQKTKEVLKGFADFLNALDGKYITAKDVGISVPDLDFMAEHTEYVRGRSGETSSGDPSPMTAFGVYQGIKSAAQFKWGSTDLKGKTVVIQGLGHVGLSVCEYLHKEGAVLKGCDINRESVQKAVDQFSLIEIGLDEWVTTPADIFSPCAMGAILNDESIDQLNQSGIQIIAGGANNQLLDVTKHGEALRQLDILYAPDYIINAGGIINIACEFTGENAKDLTSRIFQTSQDIFTRAKAENKSPAIVSLEMAREKVGLA